MNATERTSEQLSGRTWWVLLALVFALALGLRLSFLGSYERHHPQAQRPLIDEASYEDWALEIAGGDWLGDEIFFQEPLYPYWLGSAYTLSGPELAARRHFARRLQAALGALGAVLCALLAARFVPRRWALVAGLALALHRPAIWMSGLLLKPNLFLPLFVGLALALVATRARAGRGARLAWLGVGVLVGLGALLRGNMLILAPAFVLWPLARAGFERRPLRAEVPAALAVALGVVLALAPVALRNRAVGGELVLSTSGAGTNVFGGNNTANPYGLATEFDWVRGVPEHEAADWKHEAERRLGRTLSPTEVSRYWLGQTLTSMATQPLAHLTIFWNKLRLSLGAYEVPDNHYIEWDARWVPFLRAPLPGFELWGTLGLAGLFFALLRAARVRASVQAEALEVALLLLLYLATIVLTVTSERVRLPLVGLLAPFAAVFLAALASPRGRVPELALGLVLALLAVFVPVLPAEKRAADFDERDVNLAVGWVEDPRHLEDARALIESLERRHPSSPRVLLLAADLEFRTAHALLTAAATGEAQRRQAQAGIARAMERLARAWESPKPRERFQANLLAGAIQQFLGNWRSARTFYADALLFDPSDRDLRRRHAVATAEEAVTFSDPDARRQGLQRAIDELRALLAESPDAEVRTLLGKLEAAL